MNQRTGPIVKRFTIFNRDPDIPGWTNGWKDFSLIPGHVFFVK